MGVDVPNRNVEYRKELKEVSGRIKKKQGCRYHRISKKTIFLAKAQDQSLARVFMQFFEDVRKILRTLFCSMDGSNGFNFCDSLF